MTLLDPFDLADEELLLNRLDPAARPALIDFWERRADGEWTTAAALQHVHDDLRAMNAPPELVGLAATAVADEQHHTAWCLAMSRRVGGKQREQARILGDKPLSFSGATARENQVLRVVFSGCISETIALHILRESQSDIAAPALREVNRQHMSEEVGHGQIGWAFLAWANQSGLLNAATRRLLERAALMLYQLSERAWLGGAREGYPELPSMGFLSGQHIRRGIERAREEVISTGFRYFGLDVTLPSTS